MQIDDELGANLHDRKTRGQPLIAEEELQLQAWYDKWDEIEMEQLKPTPDQVAAEEARLVQLRAQIKDAETQVAWLIESNLNVIRQNDLLRAEIEVLRNQPAVHASTDSGQQAQVGQSVG